MAESDGTVQVLIEGNEYSILSEPASDSAVVLSERKALDGILDLRQLVFDMGLVGSSIRIAHNAIVAGSYGKPKMANLQAQVYNIGIDITKLCDKAASTLHRFSVTSNSIIVTLKSTYQNLLDDLDDMALDDLSSMSKLAGQMADAADQLTEEFEKEQVKVLEAIGNIELTQEDEKKETERIKVKKIKLQKDYDEVKQKMEESAAREREIKEKGKELFKAPAEKPAEKNVLEKLVSVIPIIGALTGDASSDREKAASWKEKAVQKLREEQEARNQRYAYLHQLNESVANLELLHLNPNQIQLAVQFLQRALETLKKLVFTMKKAANFWSEMSYYCCKLTEDQFRDTIENAMKKRKTDMSAWTSTAVSYYGQWVALSSMCVEYMKHLKKTQADLYKYIVENVDHAQAEASLPGLVKNFKSEAQKAIQDEVQNEIEDVEKSTLECKDGLEKSPSEIERIVKSTTKNEEGVENSPKITPENENGVTKPTPEKKEGLENFSSEGVGVSIPMSEDGVAIPTPEKKERGVKNFSPENEEGEISIPDSEDGVAIPTPEKKEGLSMIKS